MHRHPCFAIPSDTPSTDAPSPRAPVAPQEAEAAAAQQLYQNQQAAEVATANAQEQARRAHAAEQIHARALEEYRQADAAAKVGSGPGLGGVWRLFWLPVAGGIWPSNHAPLTMRHCASLGWQAAAAAAAEAKAIFDRAAHAFQKAEEVR